MDRRRRARGVGAWARRALALAVLHALLLVAGGARAAPPRTVRVGVYQNKPKVFIDEAGRPSGVFMELLAEIAESEGWTLVHVPCEWSECLRALDEGKLDLMPDVAYSRERGERFRYHRTPVLESWSQIYARPDASIRVLSDVHRRRVAVLEGSIQQAAFQQMTKGFGFEVTFVPTRSFEDAFGAVQRGDADAAIANHLFGDYSHAQYGLVRTSVVFQVAELYFVTGPDQDAEVLDAIDRHLDAWRREPNSAYYRALDHWMDRPPRTVVPDRVLWIIGVALGLLLLAAGWVLLLRVQVRARTRHLSSVNAELRQAEVHRKEVEEQRAKLEEQLRQSQKLEAIGSLAGSVAHDFNNLLAVIHTSTDMALLEAKDDGGNGLRQHLMEIAAAGRRGEKLTSQLLAFGRRQVLELQPVSLNQVTTDVEPMLRRVIDSGIDLRLSLAPELPPTLADSGQLEQVLMNLVVNARDAMPSGGQLTISTAEQVLGESDERRPPHVEPGRYVVLSVTDTGIGMDAQTRARIFEPFFTTKEPGKGTGLGLASVYGIVHQSHGHIDVESAPGRGTTFRIYLPCEPPEALEPSPKKNAAPASKPQSELPIPSSDRLD